MIDETVDESNEELGLLGSYGVMVVPAPADRAGGWFVTLSVWDEDQECYVAGSDGPIFDNREDALREATRILDWVASRSGDDNLFEVWAQMQQMSNEHDMWPDGRPRQLL